MLPILGPYSGPIAIALLFLVLAAGAALAFSLALRHLVDDGLLGGAEKMQGECLLHLRAYFGLLFVVALAVALFSAVRFYLVSWLGERISADIRNRVYAHVLKQSPTFLKPHERARYSCGF